MSPGIDIIQRIASTSDCVTLVTLRLPNFLWLKKISFDHFSIIPNSETIKYTSTVVSKNTAKYNFRISVR